MTAALRYCASMLWATAWHSLRVILTWLRGVRYTVGGPYDQIPIDYCRDLLRLNHLQVSARGLERLEGVGPCVYAINHASWFDIMALMDVLPGSVKFLAKRELSWVPLFGAAIRITGQIAVDRRRRDAAIEAFDTAAAAIRGGRSAAIFVEGTRSRDGRLLPFKKGGFVLAIVAQAPLVPVYVEGSYEVLPKGSITPRPRPIVVHVGAPIATTGLGYEDRDRLSAECRAALVGLGARV